MRARESSDEHQVIGEAETLVTRGGKLKLYDGAGRGPVNRVVVSGE